MKVFIVDPRIYERDERTKLWKYIVESFNAEVALFIRHPLPKTLYPQKTLVLLHKRGKQKRWEISRPVGFRLTSYIIDAFITIFLAFFFGPRWQMYFAASNQLYGLVGLFLRSLKLVSKVVFWSTEYFPKYTQNPMLDWLYKTLDKICFNHCDFTWNTTQAMIEARGLKGNPRHLVVPYPIWKEEIQLFPPEQIEKTSLVYIGSFCGGEFPLILEALALLKKEKPSIKLLVASYEAIPPEAIKKIEELKLRENIYLLGFILKEEELDEVIRHCRVGLAPYDPASFKRYNDPARIKAYMTKWVPVITTEATELGRLLKEKKAGVVISYDAKELASAIRNLIENDSLWKECRQNAVKLLEEHFEVNDVFSRAFDQMRFRKG